MKRPQKVLVAAGVALLLGVCAVTAANAQNFRRLQIARGAAGNKGMLRPGAFLAGLGLSDQQKEQAKAILANHKADFQAQAKEAVAARKSLREAIAGGSDLAALKAAYDKVSDAGWNGLMLRTQIASELKSILTPEQQQKLQKRLQNMQGAGLQLLQNRNKKKL